MNDFSLETLLDWKSTIESASWHGKGCGSVEFGWFYTPSKGLVELERSFHI